MKIITSHVYPPIPTRNNDWCAYYDGREEAGPYGWGTTEAEAIADLTENYEAPEEAEAREYWHRRALKAEANAANVTSMWSVMARACGNWREWPGQSETDHDHPDWQAAARAILERDELRAALERAQEPDGHREDRVAQWLRSQGYAVSECAKTEGSSMNTLQTALTEAITKLSGFKPTRIVGEPNNEDCRARSDDLNDLVTNIVLPLLSAFASENSGDFGIKINLTNGLDDDLADALGAFGRREEEMGEEEHNRASRSYMRGSFAGTL